MIQAYAHNAYTDDPANMMLAGRPKFKTVVSRIREQVYLLLFGYSICSWLKCPFIYDCICKVADIIHAVIQFPWDSADSSPFVSFISDGLASN